MTFCDADNIATWIWNWVVGILVVWLLIELIMGARSARKGRDKNE